MLYRTPDRKHEVEILELETPDGEVAGIVVAGRDQEEWRVYMADVIVNGKGTVPDRPDLLWLSRTFSPSTPPPILADAIQDERGDNRLSELLRVCEPLE